MDRTTAIVIFNIDRRNLEVDLEIPLNISANELVIALNYAYGLGINNSNIKKCYLKAENPIALLRGDKSLAEYGVRNGTVIYYTD